MNAGEWYSGESWTRRARLKRTLVKLVTVFEINPDSSSFINSSKTVGSVCNARRS